MGVTVRGGSRGPGDNTADHLDNMAGCLRSFIPERDLKSYFDRCTQSKTSRSCWISTLSRAAGGS